MRLPFRIRWLSLLIVMALMACGQNLTPTPLSTNAAPTVSPVSTTPTVAPTPTVPPTARAVAEAYVAAWQTRDYAAMYGYLSAASRAQYPIESFAQQHITNYITLTITAITPTLTTFEEAGDAAQAQVHLVYSTVLVGALETDVTVPLVRAAGAWGVQFAPALIWPDLVDGQQLYMAPFAADRGGLYDRNGTPLAATAEVYSIGLVPGEVLPDDEEIVLTGLAQLTGMSFDDVLYKYQTGVANQYIPLTEAPASVVERRFNYLFPKPGAYLYPYTGRYYAGNGDAAPVTGYTSPLQPEETVDYLARGYLLDQRVGRSGIERSSEATLAGHNGGQLVLLDASGQPLRVLSAPVSSVDGQDVYTTLDFELQQAAQFALGDLVGAIVVLNRNTGEVLAMASNPTYDPNWFDPNNYNRTGLGAYFNDAREPLINRAAQSSFPAGSVFKIVTMAAGLTSKLFTPETVYECTGQWSEAGPSAVLDDWTVALDLAPHGELTLVEGLSASCNPWFYHIGYALFQHDPAYESAIARQFGLGQTTGLGAVEETPGLILDPTTKLQIKGEPWEPLDSVNMAIGQGDVLVTPLQMARLVAAVGNGGTLYQPQLIWRIQSADGVPTFDFSPIVVGSLPIDPAQLTAIQTGMQNVLQEPLGTARNRFRNLPRWLNIAGKTGTAEDPGVFGTQAPHAWFAGYSFVANPDRPDIAVAVVVTNQGQGSDFAAPIFRRIVESYFGISLTRYPWESSVGIVRTPEPTLEPGTEATATPTP